MTRAAAEQTRTFSAEDAARLRDEFPILTRDVHGHPLVYMDSAATTQKPRAVLEAVRRYYERSNANVHRGVHVLSQEATEAYEAGRERVRRFLGAEAAREIVFTRGTTEAINLVAQSWARPRLREGDEIVVTRMEHHSNIVPWQLVCEETGATLRVASIDGDGTLLLDELDNLLTERTRLVAASHVSNALGTINPVHAIVERARRVGARVLLDGAQAAPHVPIDVRGIGCDFYAFSGHKVFGPTGIGALYARADVLESMPPWQGGGEMIKRVSFEETTYHDIPHRFEAGTPNIAGVIGLAAALDFVASVGLDRIAPYEAMLLERATAAVEEVPGARVIGTAPGKVPVVSFVVEGVHPHDLGTFLDSEGIAVRTGHHCAQPLMDFFGVTATTRASLAMHNTPGEIDALGDVLRRAVEFFG